MAATVWKGHLTFGLVSIPVRLYRAARAERVRLHQLYRPERPAPARNWRELVEEPRSKDAPSPPVPALKVPGAPRTHKEEEPAPPPPPVARVHQAHIAGEERRSVAPNEIVKGYEYGRDQYVVLEDEDLKKIAPATASEMQIIEFVRFAEIDPVFLETSYYLSPEEAGEKAYALLLAAMRETGYAALAQVAMHRREHVMILRPGRTGIVTHTMFFPDEVRSIEEFRTETSMVQPRELALARTLIEALATPFEPSKFKDSYRERLQALIEAKAQGRELAPVERAAAASNVVDISAALEKTLASMRKTAPPKPAATETSARKAAKRTKRA